MSTLLEHDPHADWIAANRSRTPTTTMTLADMFAAFASESAEVN